VIRKIHKWTGLILGLQFLLWSLSGAVMALLDKDAVGAHGPMEGHEPPGAWPEGIRPLPGEAQVEALTLRRIFDRPVYEVRSAGEVRLIDARTGTPLRIDAALAERVARAEYWHWAPLRSATLLDRPNLEARSHDGPMWRIDFADAANSSAYVHAVTGRPLESRSDAWRLWDVAWMLHNMDYRERKSFNHPLIVTVTFATLWLAVTGFWLLFKSFRRSDFRLTRRGRGGT
jgi:hypothetical protein